jgi:hypothetical protein
MKREVCEAYAAFLISLHNLSWAQTSSSPFCYKKIPTRQHFKVDPITVSFISLSRLEEIRCEEEMMLFCLQWATGLF